MESGGRGQQHDRSMAELGRRGGSAKLARYGVDEFRRMGRIGGALAGKKMLAERGLDYFKELGRRGGTAVHASGQLQHASKVAGQTTLARHGQEHFQHMAELAATQKRAAVETRNTAIRFLMQNGWSIARIVTLTLQDLPRLSESHLIAGPLTAYLGTRPDSDDPHLFLSGTGRRLFAGNMYQALRDERLHM